MKKQSTYRIELMVLDRLKFLSDKLNISQSSIIEIGVNYLYMISKSISENENGEVYFRQVRDEMRDRIKMRGE